MKNDNLGLLKTPRLLTNMRSEHDNSAQEMEEDDSSQSSLRVHKFSHRDEFGWGFPEVKEVDKKKNVIDMRWINEYNDEIDKLQIVIDEERSLSFSDQSQTASECQSIKSEKSDLEESFSSGHSYEIEIPIRSLTNSPRLKEPVKLDSSLLLPVNGKSVRASTPVPEYSYNIRNCPSRDSGISATDDISDTIPEIHIDRSLLEELEGTKDYEQTEINTDNSSYSDDFEVSKQNVSEPLSESKNAIEESADDSLDKCPVWYKRFSMGENELIIDFRNINWASVEYEEPTEGIFSKEDVYDSLSSRSDEGHGSSNSMSEVESVDIRRRKSLRDLWTACDRLEASSLRRGSPFRGVQEVMDLVESLSKIDSRLEILKCDLHSLTMQASENRHELGVLQKRASNLLTSSESSRHHMSRLFCLEKLEERLQQEWWAVHYPDLVKFEGNYIV